MRRAFIVAWAITALIGSIAIFVPLRRALLAPDGLILLSAPDPAVANQPQSAHHVPNPSLFPILGLVVVIFALDLAVLWILNHKIANPAIKPEPDKADFKGKFSAKFKGMTGTVTVAALGSLGSLLTIFAVTVAAVLILSRFG